MIPWCPRIGSWGGRQYIRQRHGKVRRIASSSTNTSGLQTQNTSRLWICNSTRHNFWPNKVNLHLEFPHLTRWRVVTMSKMLFLEIGDISPRNNRNKLVHPKIKVAGNELSHRLHGPHFLVPPAAFPRARAATEQDRRALSGPTRITPQAAINFIF